MCDFFKLLNRPDNPTVCDVNKAMINYIHPTSSMSTMTLWQDAPLIENGIKVFSLRPVYTKTEQFGKS